MTINRKIQAIYDKMRNGDRRSLSRLITLVENEDERVLPIMKQVYRDTGKAFRIGITGPPGAGKSTLVNALASKVRASGQSVGIIAVDPTSQFTGGALLGDRIRMNKVLTDREIFMRSMASRGGVGGLARTTPQAMDLLDSFGFDVVIVETVGVGQLELDVADTVDTTVVVLVPETSGNVQAMKAGLIEIADIFNINKADREGADNLKQELLDAMDLLPPSADDNWQIPILKTSAYKDEGVDVLWETLNAHHEYQKTHEILITRRIEQKKRRIIELIKYLLENRLWKHEDLEPFLDRISRMCVEGDMDPYTAADLFLRRADVQNVEVNNPFLCNT